MKQGFCRTTLFVLLAAGISGSVQAQNSGLEATPPKIRGTADEELDPSTGKAGEDEKKKEPAGASVSGVRSGSRIIEKFGLERVPVLPGDPESAWWEANPREAFSLAQRQQKPLLLLFTADWNAKCMALSNEVFGTQSFNDYVKDRVIICYLNYPRNPIDAPDAMREWKEKFKVMGYPNLLIFDPEGNVAQELAGYTTGKPVTYFGRLKAIANPVVAAVEERKRELRIRGFREWSNQDGQQIFARFIKWGGNQVTLQSADTNLWNVEISTLAAPDQQFVKSFPSIEEVAAGNN